VQEPSLQQTAHEDSVYKLILKVKDPDSDSLTVKFNNKPEWLTLSLSSPEKEGDQFTINLEGTPLNKHVGDNHLHMVITDSKSDIPYGTVIIKVSNTNDSPVAKNKQVTVLEQTPLPIKLEATDPDKNEFLKYRIHEKPTHISTEIFQLNKSTVIYTSNSDTATSDKFSFEVCDLSNACDIATVNIAITPIDDDPRFIANIDKNLIALEDIEYRHTLRIEDPDSDVLFLQLDKFPNWLKLNEIYGQGDKLKLYKNTGSDFEAILRGTPTDLYIDGNYDNNVKITIDDSPITSVGNIVAFELPLSVININDNPKPWAWGSDLELAPIVEGGTEWNWQLPSNIVAKDGKEFSFNLFDYITFVDADGDTLYYEASLFNGAPLPEWLIFDERETNFSGKKYFFSGTPSEDDVSNSNLEIRLNAYDGNGGMASVYFNLPLENIEHDPILTGDFTAPIYLRSSYTLTADDLFYHDSDSADSTDKIRFHVSNMQNGSFQNFSHGSLSFTGEQLINGELTWILDNNETLPDTSFEVLITDNSGRSSSTKTFNLSIKKSSESNLAPNLVVDLKTKTFSWQSVNTTFDAIYEYIFCEWNYDYMRAINCQDWVESENTNYKISEYISGSYSLHVREIQRITDEGTVFEIRSPIADKSIAIPIIKILDKAGKEVKRDSVTTDKEVTVKIDLLFKPAVSSDGYFGMQRMINESISDHLQFYPEYDITVDNATWTPETDTISNQTFKLNVEANDYSDTVTVTIDANQYSHAENNSQQNAMATVSWIFDNTPSISKINPKEPNTFKWNLSSGGGDSIFLYQLYNWKSNQRFYSPKLENVTDRKDQWNKDNGDTIDVEVDSVSPGNYMLTIKGSGQYTIGATEKFGNEYPFESKQTIFIPQINVLNSANHLITSNTNIGISKTDRTTLYQSITLIIDTMVEAKSFSEENITVTNGKIVKETWKKTSSTKYKVEIKADNEDSVKITIDRNAYKDKDQDEYNEKAEVTWKYDPNHKPLPTIMRDDDVETIISNGNLSITKSVAIKINVSEYKKNWPNVNWKDSYLLGENIFTRSAFRQCSPESNPEICTYPMLIEDKNCSGSEGCTVKLFVKNPDGYNVDSLEWKYTPTPKGNEQQEPIDNQLGPAPELILRDEGANNQRERVLEIKGTEFTIGRNTPHYHPDMQIDGGRLIHFNQIQPGAWAATIEANEPGTVTAIIFENIGGQNNKSASKNWAYQPDDNNQNNKIVTPKITVKDGTGKIIGDTTNRSRVTVEIDTIVDTTDFKKHHLLIEGASAFSFKSQGNSKRLYKVNLLTEQPQISLRIKADTYRENQDSQNSTSACKESKANCKRNAEASIQWTYDPQYNSGKELNIGWVWSAKENTNTKIYTGTYRYKRAGTDDWSDPITDISYYPAESLSEGTHKLEVQAQFNSIDGEHRHEVQTITLTLSDELKRTYKVTNNVVTKWDTSTDIYIHIKNLKILASLKSNSLLEAMYNLEDDNRHYVIDKSSIIGEVVATNTGLVKYQSGTLKNINNHPLYNASANYQDSFILKSYKANAWNDDDNLPAGDPAITSFFTVSIIDSTFSIENKLFSLEVVDRKGTLTRNLSGLIKNANGLESPIISKNNVEVEIPNSDVKECNLPCKVIMQNREYKNVNFKWLRIKNGINEDIVKSNYRLTSGDDGKWQVIDDKTQVISDESESTYTLTHQDIGSTIMVKATYFSDLYHHNYWEFSGQTEEIKLGYDESKDNANPTNSNSNIIITGLARAGEKLTAKIVDKFIDVHIAKVTINNVTDKTISTGLTLKENNNHEVNYRLRTSLPMSQTKQNNGKNPDKAFQLVIGSDTNSENGHPIVEIHDKSGVLVKDSQAEVSIKADGDAILDCDAPCEVDEEKQTVSVNATNGVATFTGFTFMGNAGIDYNLSITSPNLKGKKYNIKLTKGETAQLTIKALSDPLETQNLQQTFLYTKGKPTLDEATLEFKLNEDTFTYSLKDYDFPNDEYEVADIFSFIAHNTVTGQKETGLVFLKIKRNSPINIVINDKYSKQAVVGTKITKEHSVKVTDSNGEGIEGVTVNFKVGEGYGYVKEYLPVTDNNGIATIGSWTLGIKVGINKLTASVTQGVNNTSIEPVEVEFEVEGIADQAIKFDVVEEPVTGAPPVNQSNIDSEKTNSKYPKNKSGKPIPVQPRIKIYDQYGNLANSNASVTVKVNDGILSCNVDCHIHKNIATINAVQGIATFIDLALEGKVGQDILWKGEKWKTIVKTGYFMTFHSHGLESDNRIYRLELTPGNPYQLVIIEPTSPIEVTNGAILTPLKVKFRDSAGNLIDSTNQDGGGNTVTDSNEIINISIDGDENFSLACHGEATKCLTAKVIDGIATFKNIKIEGMVGQTYTLTFESGAIKSTVLDITIDEAGVAAKLVLGDESKEKLSETLQNGQTLPTLNVEIKDSSGNTVTDHTPTVEIAIDGNAKLFCEDPCVIKDSKATVRPVNGKASFDNVRIVGKEGNTYNLTITTESGEQQLTASVNNKKVTYTVEISYPVSKLTITKTPLNANKFKINISDLIATKRKEYLKKGISILNISDAMYSDEVAEATYKSPYDDLIINVKDDKNTHNEKLLKTALLTISTNLTKLSHLDEQVIQEITLMPRKCKKGPVDAIVDGTGDNRYWVDAYNPGKSLEAVLVFDIPIINEEKKYNYKLEGSGYAGFKRRPIYYDCGASSNEETDEQTKKAITIPSMAIQNEAQIGEIHVEIQDYDGNRLSSAKNVVTVALNRQTYPPLQCIDAEMQDKDENDKNHCEDARLSCSNNIDDCKKVRAENGIATFDGLVLNGQVGKIYSLQFTTGELDTANNHKSQVYIYKAGEISVSESEIKVVEAEASITADGKSSATITVQLNDASGNPIMGKQVTLNTNIGTFENNEDSIVVTDKGNGLYEAPITSLTLGDATITAELDDSEITAEKVIEFKAGEAANISTITRGNKQIDNFGDSVKSSFSVTIKDNFKHPVNEQVVTFTVEGGGYIDNNGTTFVTVPTNTQGIATLDSQRWILGDQPNSQTLTASIKINNIEESSTITANTRSLVIHQTPSNDVTEKIYFGDFIYQKIDDTKASKAPDYQVFAYSYKPPSKSYSDYLSFDLKEKEDKNYIRSYLKQQHEDHHILFLTGALDKEHKFKFLPYYDCKPNAVIAEYISGSHRYVDGWRDSSWNLLETPVASKFILPDRLKDKYSKNNRPIYYNCKSTPEILTFPKTYIANASVLNGYQIAFYDTENNVLTDTNGTIKVEINSPASLDCEGGGDDCLTEETTNGVATFNGLVIKGEVGKIYNLTFTSTTDSFATQNNYKSQVYIYKAGEFSKDKSKIDVEEGKESITADGTSTTKVKVQLKDASGNPITGKQVTLNTNIGSFENNKQRIVVTDKGNGIYEALVTSTNARTAIIIATVGDQQIEGNASVNFIAGKPHKIEIIRNGNTSYAQTAIVGNKITGIPLKFKVTDAQDNPIATTVTLEVISGNGLLNYSPKAAHTNDKGIANFEQISWFVGKQTGKNQLNVSVDGIQQSVEFKVEGVSDGPFSISEYTDDSYAYSNEGPAGNKLTNPPKVLVKDQYDNLVNGHNIPYTISSEDNRLVEDTAEIINGIATLNQLLSSTHTRKAGNYEIVAKIDSEKVVTFNVKGTADYDNLRFREVPEEQTTTVGTKVERPPSVTVTDDFGNLAKNKPVIFEIVDSLNLHQNDCGLEYLQNDTFYGSLKANLGSTDSQSFVYKTIQDKDEKANVSPANTYFNDPENDANGQWRKDNNDGSIEKIYCTNYLNKPKHVATEIITDQYGKATLPNWFLGHKAGAEYELKAYINKGTNNQSSISFFATATATLNHTKRISVTEVIENGGIEIIQDLDANYQAKLSHIEIDQIHDKYGNKIYAKDSEDIETPTGEFKIHISIKDDESNYQLECKPSQASNACEGDNNKVTLTFTKEDVENKKLKFEDVLFTGKYNKEYKILFEIEGIERELQEFNLDPTLTINRTKPRLALRTYYPTGEEPSNYENLDKKRETKTIEVRNGTMEHTPNDLYIDDHPVVGDIDERSLKIDIEDPNGSAANITEIKSIIIEIEGEEGTLSCDDKTLCKKEGEDESVAVYPSGEIFSLETMGIQGKVGQTYTLKFTSEGLISTTLTVTINKAGEPAKLSIKQQPSDAAENGVPLKVQPIIQFLDANNNIVAKPDIAVQVNYQTTIHGEYECDLTDDFINPTIDCKNDNPIIINNYKVETAESGQAIFDLTLNGKVGIYTLTFTAENLEKIESQPIKLIAGPAAKLKFIQPSSTITSGEPLEKQPIIKLVDSAGNDVKSDGVTITAEVNNQTLIDEHYCTNYNFVCTNPILYGTKVVQTDKSGQAKFTDLSISGQLNKQHVLIFTATVDGQILKIVENITIDKPGKPTKIQIHQDPIHNGFSSESVLNHVQVQIQDSGGNEVEISLSAGAQLDIELTEGTNAELGCVDPENHGCIPDVNGKKITIQIYQPTNTLDTVILAGKIDSHKLEFKAEFSNTDYVIGEQSFNIDHAGKVTDIFIIHPLNKEEIKEYHDIVELKQMSHCNPLKGGNYTFKDKYKNTIKDTLTRETLWQREHNKEILYEETLFIDVNTKGESIGVFKSDDLKIWSEPVNKNQAGDIGRYRASVDGTNNTNCTYNFYEEIAEEIVKLKWPLESNFSSINFFEYQEELYLKDHISPLRGKFEPELSSNRDKFIYQPNENSINTLGPQRLTKFDSFTISVYKDKIKYFDLPYSISILHDPHYNKQWHMNKSNGLNINSVTKKGYTGEGVTVAIIGDGIDINHSDLDLTNNVNDQVISSDGSLYYQTDYVDFRSSDENSNNTYASHSVAGIIGATGWNNKGIRGIAPKVKLKGFRLAKDIKLIPILKYGVVDESWALGEPMTCLNSSLYKLSPESCKEIESELTNFRMDIRPNHNIIYNLTYDTSRTAQNRLDATLEELFWSTEKPVFFFQQQPTSITVNADNQQNIKSNGGIFIRGAGDGFKKFGGVICGEKVCESSTELCLEPFDYPLSCQITSMDPRANHPAMINVAALDKQGKIASYSAHGSSNWISAPGGEEGEGIQTTCYNNNNNCINGYTNSFYGTSAASAMASGTVALMLDANYKLTWRDVKYILAKTANTINSDPYPSSDNKAGYVYSNAYGFGVINASEAVDMAKSYQQDLGELLHAKESSEIKTIMQHHDAYIEAIKIKVAFKPYEASLVDNITTGLSDITGNVFSNIVPSFIANPGYLDIGFPFSIKLISPAGTRSVLLSPHSAIEALELNDANFAEIELSTNAFFGEKMKGNWELIIDDHYTDFIHRSNFKMFDYGSWELSLYGTQTDISKNPTSGPNQTIN
jgi:hypothetical protein